jgi:DeoR family suf operon transcriptional repressor
MLRRQLLNTSRGRIVTLLQRGGLTADEVASTLGLTANAVRAQITAMERDGVVQRSGRRPGTTRPSHVFELTPEVEQVLSRAYVPLLNQLVTVVAERLPSAQVEALLCETGKGLAKELTRGRRLSGNLRTRVAAASQLLNDELGAVTHVEENGHFIIRGAVCPVAVLTGKNAAVCVAMESFVAEVIGARVRQCCDHNGRSRCGFEIRAPKTR